jgi:acyl-coenzyme A synthetase/AMP-(fatty) acid ligase
MAQMYPQKVAVVLDDQTWTYSELIEQIERVTCCLQRLNIVRGQIIYQFVERGFEMICGFFGIMYVGGVYCPLNPKEPSERLAVLFQHIQGQYVLLHEKTRNQFPSTAVEHMVLLDHILHPLFGIQDMDDLPVYSEWGPAFIIFTSGTTGRPKAIVHTHKSLLASVIAYVQWDLGIYTIRDQALQVASCSWILHVYEILLPPVVGGTLVLLKPGGNLDMSYFSRTLFHQQVTTFIIGPALIRALINYLKMSRRLETFKFVRNVCMAGDYELFIYSQNCVFDSFGLNLGEAVKPHEWVQFTNFLSSFNACMSVLYGMSECSGVIGCSLLNIDDAAVPIGYPLPGVYHLLIDEQGQVINHTDNSSAIGQIHIGG